MNWLANESRNQLSHTWKQHKNLLVLHAQGSSGLQKVPHRRPALAVKAHLRTQF